MMWNDPRKSGQKVLVMILAGGKGKRLHPLTRYRAKAAVPFLGAYRLIDFALSNCLHSGLPRILVLTQHKSDSLQDHIHRGWDLFHPELGGYIKTVPPQRRLSRQWYRGTADAVYQNLHMLEREKPDLVLILSGDQVYRMDYRPMIESHVEHGADVTVASVLRRADEAADLGVLQKTDEGRVTAFLEKPDPTLLADSFPAERVPCSAGIYLFETGVLVERLIEDIKTARTHDFGAGILPHMVEGGDRVYGYNLNGQERTSYWRDVGTVGTYWRAQMEFLEPSPPFALDDPDWPIRCLPSTHSPARFSSGAEDAPPFARDSLICNGTVLCGGRVEHSIIGPGASVRPGSVIQDSVIMEDVVVGSHCSLSNTIIDAENEIVGSTRLTGEESDELGVTRDKVTVVPRSTSVPDRQED